MYLWVAETSYLNRLVTLAETKEEAQSKIEAYLVHSDESIKRIIKEEDVIYV